MFEKEAEEYAEKKICQEYNDGCMGFYKCKEYCERYHNTQKYWKAGAEFGYNKANAWHNLQENPTDLPKCAENEQIIFYVNEWFESIQKYRTHYCLGFYRKAFLNESVKLFVEKSRGYENEHLPISVLRWRELEKWESE